MDLLIIRQSLWKVHLPLLVDIEVVLDESHFKFHIIRDFLNPSKSCIRLLPSNFVIIALTLVHLFAKDKFNTALYSIYSSFWHGLQP